MRTGKFVLAAALAVAAGFAFGFAGPGLASDSDDVRASLERLSDHHDAVVDLVLSHREQCGDVTQGDDEKAQCEATYDKVVDAIEVFGNFGVIGLGWLEDDKSAFKSLAPQMVQIGQVIERRAIVAIHVDLVKYWPTAAQDVGLDDKGVLTVKPENDD